MGEITTVGLDLAKRVVQLHAEDGVGRVVLRRTLKREAVLARFAQRPPCVIGMEACASAHHFARELAALGHTPRIIAPEFVRPLRMSGEERCQRCASDLRRGAPTADALRDAEERRAAGALGGQGLQEERSAALNRLRGLLAEFGRVYANSASAALAGARGALADEELPATLRQCVARQLTHLRELDSHLADCDREAARDARADPRAQRVVRLSGVGVLSASAIAATVVDAQQFRCGRQFAASLGLTPRQYSTGGKTRLGRITRRGDVSAHAPRAGRTLGVAIGAAGRAHATNAIGRLDRRHLRAHRLSTRRWWRSPTSMRDWCGHC